ncbi:MAG TPA: hypothetical protein VL588_03220 [Bdellovibrionota bacterium]|nr:hypothetical protein [Bdellovibrionota bacterium]
MNRWNAVAAMALAPVLFLAAGIAHAEELVAPGPSDVLAVQGATQNMVTAQFNLLKAARECARHTYHSFLPPSIEAALNDIKNIEPAIRGVNVAVSTPASLPTSVSAYLTLKQAMLTMEQSIGRITSLPLPQATLQAANELRSGFRGVQDMFVSRWNNKALVAQRAGDASGATGYAATSVRTLVQQPGAAGPQVSVERTLVVAAQLDVVKADIDAFINTMGYYPRDPQPLAGWAVEPRRSLQIASDLASRPGVAPQAVQSVNEVSSALAAFEQVWAGEVHSH